LIPSLQQISSPSKRRDARMAPFSTAYSRRKWRHVHVPREPRINQRFPSGSARSSSAPVRGMRLDAARYKSHTGHNFIASTRPCRRRAWQGTALHGPVLRRPARGPGDPFRLAAFLGVRCVFARAVAHLALSATGLASHAGCGGGPDTGKPRGPRASAYLSLSTAVQSLST
jgi:hypothetical protein